MTNDIICREVLRVTNKYGINLEWHSLNRLFTLMEMDSMLGADVTKHLRKLLYTDEYMNESQFIAAGLRELINVEILKWREPSTIANGIAANPKPDKKSVSRLRNDKRKSKTKKS